jgi:predicted CopG family antitoxin
VSVKPVYKRKLITIDEETERIMRELKNRGHSISALIRYLIKQYYETHVVKESK